MLKLIGEVLKFHLLNNKIMKTEDWMKQEFGDDRGKFTELGKAAEKGFVVGLIVIILIMLFA